MKDVPYREFQLRFAQHKDSLEELRICGKGGVIVGYYNSALLNKSVKQEEPQEEALNEEVLNRSKEEKITDLRKMFDTRSQEGELCTQCKKGCAEYRGEHWEDGEAHEVKLCQTCYGKYPSKKNFKKIISTL